MALTLGAGVRVGPGISLIPEIPAITIGTQPSNASVTDAQTATFSVSATVTYGATLTYQWQKQESGAGAWSNISGATSSSYTTGSITVAADNTDAYRVVVSATGATSVTSNSVTLTVTAASTPNSISVVAYDDTANSGKIYYGASVGTQSETGYLTFGTVTSDYIDALAQVAYGSSPNYVVITLNQGSYSTANGSFSVGSQSLIDSDWLSYYRTFTINGSNYVFTYDNYGYRANNSLSDLLYNAVGTTISVVYDPSIQPSYSSETMYIDEWNDGSNHFYGANANLYVATIFGQLLSSQFTYIFFNSASNYTVIGMKSGSQNGYTVTNRGSINSDTTGSKRHFTINNTVYPFQHEATYYDHYYYAIGDILGLMNGTIGSAWSVNYDPSVESSYTSAVEGYMRVGQSYPYKGAAQDYSYGSISSVPSVINYVRYDGSNTTIALNTGTYGSLSVTSTSFGGQSNLTANIGGVAVNSTSISGGIANMGNSDVFSLASKSGQTLFMKFSAYSSGGGGGGGSGTTYTGGTDYANGSSGPSGASFAPVGGPYSYPQFFLDSSYWSNSTGFNAVKALTSGSTFTVSAYAASGGGSIINSTITLLSNFTNPYGTQWRADMSSSPTVSTGSWPNYVPLSITLSSGDGGGGGGGGGSGSTSVTLYNGIWFSDGGISFRVLATDTTNISKMDAISSGATLYLTDISNNTATVTLSGSLTKSGPMGPPGGERYFWDGTVTTTNADFPGKFGYITSLTY
jgi:hypothetical protein